LSALLARKLAAHGETENKAQYSPAGSAIVRGRPGQENDMKVISISTRGVQQVAATKTRAKNGAEYYALSHGEDGRGRWQIRLPLAAREFPAPTDAGEQLVLWHLSPGYRGGASFGVAGQATAVAVGEEAQGAAGRMGGADCPVVLVTGPCQLSWHRSGRLYGSEADWSAVFDGQDWTVAPTDQCSLEQAALNY
jgi:hypothetical protein